MLPKVLNDQGIPAVIAPLATKMGPLWASLDRFTLVLYPFVEGHDGYEVTLWERQWGEFGQAPKRIHTATLPAELLSRIPQETYSPQWRESVRMSLERVESEVFNDAVAVRVAALLRTKREVILDLVARAERLADVLRARPPEFVLCHSDI